MLSCICGKSFQSDRGLSMHMRKCSTRKLNFETQVREATHFTPVSHDDETDEADDFQDPYTDIFQQLHSPPPYTSQDRSVPSQYYKNINRNENVPQCEASSPVPQLVQREFGEPVYIHEKPPPNSISFDLPTAYEPNDNIYHPFQTHDEFWISNFIYNSKMSSRKVDKLFQKAHEQNWFVDSSGQITIFLKNSLDLKNKTSMLITADWEIMTYNFQHKEDGVWNGPYEIHVKDPVSALVSLYQFMPLFKHMIHKSFKEFHNGVRVVNEAQSANQWRELEDQVSSTGILAPIAISSDATLLSEFGMNQEAYPFYLTSLAIPKDIRSETSSYSWELFCLGPQLRVPKQNAYKTKLDGIRSEFFHGWMALVLFKFDKALEEPIYVRCADTRIRELHVDIFAWICDLQEAWKLTGVVSNACHICEVPKIEMGDLIIGSRAKKRKADDDYVSELYNEYQSATRPRKQQIKEVFKSKRLHRKANLLAGRCSRFNCIQLDLLHQLFKGCFETLKESLKQYIEELPGSRGTRAFEAKIYRMVNMPPFTGLPSFKESYYDMGRKTARHHRDLMKVWLGVLTDLPGIGQEECKKVCYSVSLIV